MTNAERKRSIYFPEDMLAEILAESVRQDRSMSWLLQRAWKIARGEIMAVPGVDVLDKREAA
jgi:uncharacterized small protein (TIGR04563 family)